MPSSDTYEYISTIAGEYRHHLRVVQEVKKRFGGMTHVPVEEILKLLEEIGPR